MELKFTATEEKRLSALLKEDMGISTGLMNKLKWQDKLFVNGIPRRTNYMVAAGDVVTVPLEEETPDYPAEQGELTVLYEDEHILAVDKPSGILVHPSRSAFTGTLANRVLGYYQKTSQSCAFHPITRLDRDTFGIVLLAKNAHIHALLNQLHSEGKLQKIYHARVLGGPEAEEGVIDAPIARKPLPSLLRYVNRDGKPSVTKYRVLERRDGTSLLELSPITGRTHHLRVHCSYMGFPILGDPQYGTEEAKKYAEHQLLCAKTLTFPHPVTKAPMVLSSQLDV